MTAKILDRNFVYHPAAQHMNSADEFKKRMASRIKQAMAERIEPVNVTRMERKWKKK